MPRDDFVQACVDTVDQIPQVIESTVNGTTLQSFLVKQRPVLYGTFCQHMVGLQHPVDGKCVKQLTDVDVQLMASALTPQKEIKAPIGEYTVNEAYYTLKTVHEFAMDPNGLQVANYVTLVLKCIFIGRAILGEVRFPEGLDAFCNSISGGRLETCANFLESLGLRDGEAMDVLRRFSERNGRLSTWQDYDMIATLFPRFTEEAHRFCVAQVKSSGATLQAISKHFQSPQTQGGELARDKQFYANCANIGITPFWLFYEPVDPVTQTMVDISSLITCPPFDQLYKLANSENRRARDKLLGFPWMRKSWDAMSTIIVLNDPFTGQRRDFVKKQSIKFWSNPLSRKDFNKSPEVMANFVSEIRIRHITVTPALCKVFVKFLTNISDAVQPIPGLERQPTAAEDDARHKQILQQQIRDEGPDIGQLEEQLAQRREQLSKFPIEEPKDDSGIVLPVLLLGLGIFLLSR